MAESLSAKRVTVMGLGTRGGGVGVARYVARAGARVTVTDARPEAELTTPLTELAGLPIRYVLGGHEEADFTPDGADLIVRNPGVPRRAPMVALARRHRLPIEMEMSLFFRACPAPIIGVTGTKGKTTVSTLCAEILRAWDTRTVLAGNMGVSALDQLARITPDTPVVVELSSWQLEALIEHQVAPRIAVLTLIAEDHLNTYDSFDDYATTKRGITHYQRTDDLFVVNADDPESWRGADETRARVVPFSATGAVMSGAWYDAGQLHWRDADDVQTFELPQASPLGGRAGIANALAALAAARLRGATAEAITSGLHGFRGVRDRMELVAEVASVRFINDTTATAPVATVAAMNGLAGSGVHLIAGGADKGLDLAPLVAAAARAEHVYLLDGSATPRIADLLRAAGVAPAGPFQSMEAAVQAAALAVRPGAVVLLSPGCASFGLFSDEFDRGERFRQAVQSLAVSPAGEHTLMAGSSA